MPSSSPGLPSDQHKKLFDACRNGNILKVKKLLSKSKLDNINCRDSQGRNSTPLHLAAGYNNIDVAEFLLTKGADVNASDKGGLIPLHNAASYGHLDIAALLLKHNSQVNATDAWGFTPLHEAAQKGRIQLCALLLKHGANPYLKTNDNQTALDLASAEDVKTLLKEAMAVKALSSSTKTNLIPKIAKGSTIPSSSTSRLSPLVPPLVTLAPTAPPAPSSSSLSPTIPLSSSSPSTSCSTLTPPTPSAPLSPPAPTAPLAPSAPSAPSEPCPSTPSAPKSSPASPVPPVSSAPSSSSSPSSSPSSTSTSTSSTSSSSSSSSSSTSSTSSSSVSSSSSSSSSTSSSSCSSIPSPSNGLKSVDDSGEIVVKSIAYDIIDISIVNNNKTDKKSLEPVKDSPTSPSSRNINNNTNGTNNCNITIENATSSKCLSSAIDCNSTINNHKQLPVAIDANDNKDVKCLICEENFVNIRFYPCNHQICCSDCTLRMKRCISCKQVIEKILTLDSNEQIQGIGDQSYGIVDHTGGASKLATSPPTRIYGPFYSSTSTATLLNNNLHSIKSEIDLNISDPIQRLKYLESKIAEIAEAIQCGICLERTKNLIFLCGHGCCADCSSTLITCHMCRKTITKKINIY